jgi:hypothetical protein
MTDWRTLNHAYGNAADIAGLLQQLSPEPKASVWEELWSRLCHQGTVYSASFAALPALADAAEPWTEIEPNNGVLSDVGNWLYEHAIAAQQEEVADWIRYVFGRTECPSCGRHFAVQDSIAELGGDRP